MALEMQLKRKRVWRKKVRLTGSQTFARAESESGQESGGRMKERREKTEQKGEKKERGEFEKREKTKKGEKKKERR
jgi:hypothetical protein